MRWWVQRNGSVIGWVIAATEDEALRWAEVKYPPSWCDGANRVFSTPAKRHATFKETKRARERRERRRFIAVAVVQEATK